MRPEDLGIGRLFERVRDAVIVADAATQQIVLWTVEPGCHGDIRLPALRGARDARRGADTGAYLKGRHRKGIVRYAKTGHGV
jgi:hypothetical protein